MHVPLRSLLLVLAAVACGPAQRPTAPPDTDSGSHIPDVEDRCYLIRDCDSDFIDDDGCPDFIITFQRNSASLDAGMAKSVSQIAAELLTRKRVSVLRIDGHVVAAEAATLAQKRADAVRNSLIEHKVPAAMLQTKTFGVSNGTSGYVSFFAIECAR